VSIKSEISHYKIKIKPPEAMLKIINHYKRHWTLFAVKLEAQL